MKLATHRVYRPPRKPLTIHRQLLMMLFLLDVCVVLIFSSIFYVERKKALLSDLDEKLKAVAVMAQATLPPDYHDRITGPHSVSETEFHKIVDRNNMLCVALKLEYIWSVMLIDDQIVFTTSTSPDKVARNHKHAHFFELHSNPELYIPVFQSMRPTYKTNVDKWGNIRVALIPFVDRRGRKYIFGASVTLADVDRQLRSSVKHSVVLGLLLFLGNMLLGIRVARRIAAPIHNLTETIQSISAGANSMLADEQGSYEVVTLARHFNRLNQALHGRITDLEASRVRLLGLHEAERKQAQEHLFSSEQRYRELMNFAVDGILIGSPDGVILDANRRMCELFGLTCEEIVGKNVREMPFTAESLAKTPFRYDRLRNGESVVSERSIRRRDGSETVVEMHTKMMPDKTYQSIYHDISARKKAEQTLMQTREILEAAQQLAKVGGWEYDVATRKLMWTDEVYRIHGFGKNIDINDWQALVNRHYDGESRLRIEKAFVRAVEQGEPYDLELQLTRTNGERIWVRACAQPKVENGTVTKVSGSFMDITDRKNAQMLLESWNAALEKRVTDRTKEVERYAAQLRALTARLVRVEEDERQRIADVLHENLQQTLVAARMTLDVARQSIRGATSKEMLMRTDSMLEQSVKLTRSLVQDIAVPAVREGDLPAAFKWIGGQMNDKFGFVTEVVAEEDLEPVCVNTYLCLYRAVQEILFNAVKHAKVTHATITIRRVDNNRVCVTVEDGGVGFECSDMSGVGTSEKGIGLFGIRQRVEGLGGTMEIKTAPGQGAAIILTLPAHDAL